MCVRTEEKGLSSGVCYYSLELTTFTYNAAGAQINQFIISIVHSSAEQSEAKRVSPPKTHAVRSPGVLSNFSEGENLSQDGRNVDRRFSDVENVSNPVIQGKFNNL